MAASCALSDAINAELSVVEIEAVVEVVAVAVVEAVVEVVTSVPEPVIKVDRVAVVPTDIEKKIKHSVNKNI